MYISGTLKKKTVEFYKPSINNFSDQEFMTDKIILNYDGELLVLPWDKPIEQKLIKKQEALIESGIEKTIFVSTKKFNNIKLEITRILQKVKTTERKYSFALFECLYKIIISADTKDELILKLQEFEIFINWLDTQEINQIDLEVLISLFLKRGKYDQETLKKAKEQKFHVIEEEILSEDLYKTIIFGEFVSPSRVSKVASTLHQDIEYSKLVLPIYFAIPNELEANQFLKLCRTPDLDEEQVKKNARLLRIPTNLQNLIR